MKNFVTDLLLTFEFVKQFLVFVFGRSRGNIEHYRVVVLASLDPVSTFEGQMPWVATLSTTGQGVSIRISM